MTNPLILTNLRLFNILTPINKININLLNIYIAFTQSKGVT